MNDIKKIKKILEIVTKAKNYKNKKEIIYLKSLNKSFCQCGNIYDGKEACNKCNASKVFNGVSFYGFTFEDADFFRIAKVNYSFKSSTHDEIILDGYISEELTFGEAVSKRTNVSNSKFREYVIETLNNYFSDFHNKESGTLFDRVYGYNFISDNLLVAKYNLLKKFPNLPKNQDGLTMMSTLRGFGIYEFYGNSVSEAINVKEFIADKAVEISYKGIDEIKVWDKVFQSEEDFEDFLIHFEGQENYKIKSILKLFFKHLYPLFKNDLNQVMNYIYKLNRTYGDFYKLSTELISYFSSFDVVNHTELPKSNKEIKKAINISVINHTVSSDGDFKNGKDILDKLESDPIAGLKEFRDACKAEDLKYKNKYKRRRR